MEINVGICLQKNGILKKKKNYFPFKNKNYLTIILGNYFLYLFNGTVLRNKCLRVTYNYYFFFQNAHGMVFCQWKNDQNALM